MAFLRGWMTMGIYQPLFLLAFLVYSPVLLWRMLWDRRYRAGLRERMGGVPERALAAQAVTLCVGDGRDVHGVIANKSHHATTPEEIYQTSRNSSETLQELTNALLIEAAGAVVDGLAAVASGGASVVLGGGSSAAAAAIEQDGQIGPTVRVRQGEPIRVFTSRDLDFSQVPN